MAKRLVHQRTAHPAAPRGWIDRDGLQLAEYRVNRVTGWANAGESHDVAVQLGDGPHHSGVAEVISPPITTFRTMGAMADQFTEAAVP